MNPYPSLFELPDEDQVAILLTIRRRHSEANKELEQVNADLSKLVARKTELEGKAKKYEVFISHASKEAIATTEPIKTEPTKTETDSTPKHSLPNSQFLTKYDKGATQYDKILFITDNPDRYGRVSFPGAKTVIDAMRHEEPDLADDDATLMKRIGPAVSNLVKAGRLAKFTERKHPLRVHYVSIKWTESGELKPEYAQLLSAFDLVSSNSAPQNETQLFPSTSMADSVADKKTAPAEAEAV